MIETVGREAIANVWLRGKRSIELETEGDSRGGFGGKGKGSPLWLVVGCDWEFGDVEKLTCLFSLLPQFQILSGIFFRPCSCGD
jgi:hypothetical protein